MSAADTPPAAADEKPFVSIGIPCLDEEQYIEECIRSIYAQDYPHERFEVIVADGGSSDRTRALLDELSGRHPTLRWIDNPGRIQAAAMNEIIRQARGDVLVRLDAHTEYASNYVTKCIEVLARTGADNVGGAQRNRAKNWFQRAFCAAMDSPLAMGGASHRSADAEGFVETVCFGAFRRRVFETVGMFDAGAVTNEDAEINQRITAAGGKVYLSPEIVAHYYPRDSFGGLARQYFKYGQGRARTFLKHGRVVSLRPLAPFFAVATGSVLVLTSAWQPFTVPAASVYLLATGAEAVRVGWWGGLRNVAAVWGIFPVLHGCHGVGFAAGLLKYLRHPDWHEPERVTPRAPGEAGWHDAAASVVGAKA